MIQHDYQNVNIPAGKDPLEYTTAERRSEEYQLMLKEGTVAALNTVTLAEKYGVSPKTISKDRYLLQDYLTESFDKKNVLPDVITTKKWALKTARKCGDYKAADRICDSILDMCFNLGIMDKSADKLAVEGEIGYTVGDLVEAFKAKKRETD